MKKMLSNKERSFWFVIVIFSSVVIFLFTRQSNLSQSTPIGTPTLLVKNTLQPSQTSVPVTSTATVTPIPCFPKEPVSEIEKIADKWFKSDIPEIPSRNQYEVMDAAEGWAIICSDYQYSILSGDSAADNPIEISLQLITQSASPNKFSLENVLVIAENHKNLINHDDVLISPPGERDIVVVLVTYPYINIQFESRADYVHEVGMWKIRWIGYRWKCITTDDKEWNTGLSFDSCPSYSN